MLTAVQIRTSRLCALVTQQNVSLFVRQKCIKNISIVATVTLLSQSNLAAIKHDCISAR